MKDLFFKPEDFKFGDDGSPLSEATKLFGIKEESARTANAILNALIESWPVVYGMGSNPYWYENGYLSKDRKEIATHKEILDEVLKDE